MTADAASPDTATADASALYVPVPVVFEEVIHHLTVADGAPEPVLDDLQQRLAAALPLVQEVTEVHLAVRRSGAWSVTERLQLG